MRQPHYEYLRTKDRSRLNIEVNSGVLTAINETIGKYRSRSFFFEQLFNAILRQMKEDGVEYTLGVVMSGNARVILRGPERPERQEGTPNDWPTATK